MSTVFTPGQEVYDIRGRAGNYVGLSKRGHLVEPIYEGDELEPHFGEAETWFEVFAAAPRERLAEELADLLDEIRSNQQKLTELHHEVAAAEQVKRDVMRRAKAEPQLADLHLWLEGKVTHIVTATDYAIEIGLAADVLRSDDRYRQLRLLSLYVDPHEHSYSVRRSAYSDGSGGSFTPCRLASSEEHAKALAREHIAVQLVSGNQQHNRETWIRLAIEFDVPVTDAQRQLLADKQRVSAERYLNHARDSHQRAVDTLRAAEEQFANLISRTTT